MGVKTQIVPPVKIPIPSKIGSNMGGARFPKWVPVGFEPGPFAGPKLRPQHIPMGCHSGSVTGQHGATNKPKEKGGQGGQRSP